MNGLIDNTENEKKIARDKRRRDKELGDIRKVLSMPEGRRFYWRVLSKCGVFRSSWSGDTNQTLVNEGKREVGIVFMDDLLEASPATFGQMQREYKSRNDEED